MPIALLAVAGLMIVSAWKGTEEELGVLVASEFTGSGNFLYWLAAVAVVGGLGMVPVMRTPSRWLIALILVAMFLSHTGIIANAFSALSTAQPAAPIAPPQAAAASSSSGSNTSSSDSGDGGIGGIVGDVASALPLLAFL
jgi:hypothetical protein